MEPRLKIHNGRIITPYRLIENGTVLINGNKLEKIVSGDIVVPGALELDAKGHYISPGFIDIHVHGGGGHDFMDGNVDAFLKIAETHACYGTTSMLPTTLTAEKEELFKTLDVYKQANQENTQGAQFLGIHLEGPYFAVSQRGAQDLRYIRNPNPDEYNEILAYSKDIKRWSAAPELPGALEFAHTVKSKGILVAFAHTDAVYEEILIGFENGFSLATHFYSLMNGVLRRNAFRFAGAIECAYQLDEMNVEIIADGIHLPPSLLKLIYKLKGTDRIALITDAMRGAGMPPGESILGSLHDGLKVIIEDGVAKLPDRSSFAGSVATTNRLVRNMIQMADVPVVDAVRMISRTPATILGLESRKGSLVPGKDADIVIFDDNIEVQNTIVNGKIIYNRN